MIHPILLNANIYLCLLDTWDECVKFWNSDDELRMILNHLDEPSGLRSVNLINKYYEDDIKYKVLDFTDTTVREAIIMVLTFYKPKTIRREIREKQFFAGFEEFGCDVFGRLVNEDGEY